MHTGSTIKGLVATLFSLMLVLLLSTSCGEDSTPPTEYSLGVDKTGTGSGTVTSDPVGIDCGGDCGESYEGGTTVTLSATPDGGSVLSDWSGCDSATGTTCTVEMNGDKSVTATFMPEVVTDQFGTSNFDATYAISVDSSGVYVAGVTGEGSSAGSGDAFVRKYDASGEVVWTRQFGTSNFDATYAISVDSSGVYVAGVTEGVLEGSNAGMWDAFVRKYNASGEVVWTRQFGTSADDFAWAISVDSSGVYVAGYTEGGALEGSSAGEDAFVRKYNASGDIVWTRQFGTSEPDQATAISVDSSGVYVAGDTGGVLEGSSAVFGSAFVRKYNASGDIVWTRQFGTSEPDQPTAISVDSSGVYVAGYTEGVLEGSNAGGSDAFVRKYDASGEVVWTRQFGTSADDFTGRVSVDGSGVHVAGYTEGELSGSNAGSFDAFVRKYDASGEVVWTRQFGTSADDFAGAISVDSSGVYVAGYTEGALEGSNAGGGDAFVRIYYH